MENVATAISVVEAVFQELRADPDPETIKNGVSQTVWPGRGQMISTSPPVLLDVAHNAGGAKALKDMLREVFGKKAKGILVWSSLADKEPDTFLKTLAPCLEEIVCVELQTPRAMAASSLMSAAERSGIPAESCTLAEAKAALQERVSKVDFGCIAGSVYLAGEWLSQENPDPGEHIQ